MRVPRRDEVLLRHSTDRVVPGGASGPRSFWLYLYSSVDFLLGFVAAVLLFVRQFSLSQTAEATLGGKACFVVVSQRLCRSIVRGSATCEASFEKRENSCRQGVESRARVLNFEGEG